MQRKTIAIDFDGVLFPKEHYTNRMECSGPPMPGAVEFVQGTMAGGHKVFILTSRLSDAAPYQMHRVTRAILDWMRDYFGEDVGDEIAVTGIKWPADLYIDDKGYRFSGEWPLIESVPSEGRFASIDEYDEARAVLAAYVRDGHSGRVERRCGRRWTRPTQ